MRLLKLNRHNIKKIITETIKVLKQGGIVLFPSDTVYGLLVDATNENAVKKLIFFKQRPTGKPISVFVTDIRMIKYLCNLDKARENILNNLFPGPFTVVLDYLKNKSKIKISQLLLSEKLTLGVRIPEFKLINDLVYKFNKPITATSANLSGQSSIYSVGAFINKISLKKKKYLDLIIDAGTLTRNKPSTVLDLTSDKIKQLREGDIKIFGDFRYLSKSEEGTKKLAKDLLKNIFSKNFEKPLVFILKGPLGAGKTIFVKGLGEYFGIKNIISPSFVVYYEYELQGQTTKYKSQKFIHADLFNVRDDEELKNIMLERYLKKGNIICVEWGDKSSDLIKSLIKKAKLIYIDIEYEGIDKRKVSISGADKSL